MTFHVSLIQDGRFFSFVELSTSVNTHNTCGNELSLIESKAAIEAAQTLFRAVLSERRTL